VQTNKFSQHYEIPDEKLSYSELKDRIRKEVTDALPKKERIMLLAKKLEYNDYLAIKDTICSQICTDFKDLISPDYIRKCLPEEYKQKSKMRRRVCNTSIANDGKNAAEQITVAIDAGSTGQEITSEPESEPNQEIIKLRRLIEEKDKQLEEKDKQLEEKDKQLEEKDKQIAILQLSQKVDNIPQLVDNKIGPIKVQNLSKVSAFYKRANQILASRLGEVVRRKIVSEGKAAVRFYIVSKDRTTNIEYMAPVLFTVDMMGRTTQLELDESRL
jgi:hypothetical protein